MEDETEDEETLQLQKKNNQLSHIFHNVLVSWVVYLVLCVLVLVLVLLGLDCLSFFLFFMSGLWWLVQGVFVLVEFCSLVCVFLESDLGVSLWVVFWVLSGWPVFFWGWVVLLFCVCPHLLLLPAAVTHQRQASGTL